MRVRWIGVALALALVGIAAGYAIGVLSRPEPTTFAARPVPASSPSIPVDPERPFAPDIDYPPLEPDLAYGGPRRIGSPGYQWSYVAPRGWLRTAPGNDEYFWRPPGEPTVGGFSLRVKLVNQRLTPEQMVDQKRAAVESIYDDVEVLNQTGDQLYFTYREPDQQTKRYDVFQWFSAPGLSEAGFEMSIVGRERDKPGIADLLENVASSVRKVS